MGLFEEIVSGWKNYLFRTPEIEAKAKLRLNICISCEKLRENLTCSKCGCYVPAKVRSPKSKCPLNLWGRMFD